MVASAERRPFRDNPRLILAGIAVLVVIIAALVVAEGRVSSLAPDLLAEGVLYALTVTNFTMLLALLFLLGRNVIKSLIEGRRRLPFARFRAKLVLMMLGLTVVPALLVLLVGSRVVLTTVDRWFATPIDDILASANGMAANYYAERQQDTRTQARRLAQRLATLSAASEGATVRQAVQQEAGSGATVRVDVFRAETRGRTLALQSVLTLVAGREERPDGAGEPARLARQALEATADGPWAVDPGRDGAEWLRVAERVTRGDRVSGVVVVSERLSGGLAQRAKRLTAAYEDYSQLRVLRQPLAGVYLSFFIMATLLILVGSSWVGLYLAKRITRPVQALSVAAREISAGHYHQRIQVDASDEFAAMVEAFNAMANDVAQARQQLEAAGRDLARQHADGERRRRYIETVVERIAAGVVSIDREGRITTVNRAAQRLLSLDADVVGVEAAPVFGRPALEPLSRLLLRRTPEPGGDTVAGEVQLVQEGGERHLSAVVTPLTDATGDDDGCVLVVDDVTPLVRAQKVAAWREVARRLAHEIKNPLTPIQLSAERLRRQLTELEPARDALVRECTETITGEVESLKGLVDEFAQFARMPAPRVTVLAVRRLFDDVLALYRGVVDGVHFEVQPGPESLVIRADPEQMKRVLVNLIDNAIEAMDRKGIVWLDAVRDEQAGVVRLGVADNGPGLPASDREQLFLPYYSTKGRGSGLGLAIVRRIVVEHGGHITVSDHVPRGTRFTIELPV
ncbi:MAG: HAMP domain-containing protein [Acidobacteria bacterium]|nr:HAMP domain-containing protein [Acidobacteriota bacterium]